PCQGGTGQSPNLAAWQRFGFVYERWTLKNEIVLSTKNPPPPDYDAHLLADSYEPPPGDEMPPRTIVDTATGFRIVGNDMLPSTTSNLALATAATATTTADTSCWLNC